MKPVRSASRTPLLLASVLTVATTAAGAGLSPEPVGGCLEYIDPETEEQSGFPLEHTSVQARISGTIADVTVTQRFSNPLKVLIEAVYVFPLPDRAAVDDMSIRIGERLIKGEIHRREEARRIYLEAVEAGHVAGLLDQERPNIFTQRLANILPGESIEVEIHYVEDLHYDHGDWKMVIPTVVGPRYIPGSATGRQGSGWSPDTDQVSGASRITPPVLPPGKVSGHHIDITVDLDPGFTIGNLESPSHEVTIRRRGSQRATVSLQPLDTVPNKDFELVWRTGGPALSTATIAHKTGDFGYVTLILQPPAQPRADQIVPREVVFVLDTSGSMSGEPIGACKQLVRKALKKLREGDTFRLIQFANGTSMLDADALPATAHTIERALSFLNAMRGSGGTELLEGVRAALDAPKDENRLRMVLFLTDGYIGNEQQILGRIGSSIGESRIFALGVGNSVNRYLLDRMAEAGRGVAEYLRPGESPDELVDRFYDRISDPVFTQVELDWGDLEVVDVEPAALPDLFAARPLLVHARYLSGGRGTVTLSGYAGTERLELTQKIRLPETEERHGSQAKLWARSRIARLEMDTVRSNDAGSLVEDITVLALEHRLMTAYTSFVAVDRTESRGDGQPITIDQPLPMPEGVSYEGVFGDRAATSKVLYNRVSPEKARQAPNLGAVSMSLGSGGHALHDRMELASPSVPAPPEPAPQVNQTGPTTSAPPIRIIAQRAGTTTRDAGEGILVQVDGERDRETDSRSVEQEPAQNAVPRLGIQEPARTTEEGPESNRQLVPRSAAARVVDVKMLLSMVFILLILIPMAIWLFRRTVLV